MTRHRLILVTFVSAVVVVVSAIAGSCMRDGGLAWNRSSDTDGSAEQAAVRGETPNAVAMDGDASDDASIDFGQVNFDSFESGDLLFNAVTVERYGLDLPTFADAVAGEMELDDRIDVTSIRIDSALRPEGSPVSVIAFNVSDVTVGLQLVGRQYTLVSPDGDGFSIVTCVSSEDVVHQCDDEVRTIDLAALQ